MGFLQVLMVEESLLEPSWPEGGRQESILGEQGRDKVDQKSSRAKMAKEDAPRRPRESLKKLQGGSREGPKRAQEGPKRPEERPR